MPVIMVSLVQAKTRFSSASPDRISPTATEDLSPRATSKYTRSRAVHARAPRIQERPDLIPTQPGGRNGEACVFMTPPRDVCLDTVLNERCPSCGGRSSDQSERLRPRANRGLAPGLAVMSGATPAAI